MDHCRTIVALLTAIAPVAGCFLSTDSSNTTTTALTLLTVDPLSFRGAIRCAEGELRLYSVTLIDVTPPLAGFAPANPFPISSGLIPCNQPVLFAGGNGLVDGGKPIEIGHYYIAKIDGFDTDDVELVQTDAAATEARRISTKEPIVPHWTTTCGEPFASSAGDGGQSDAGDAGDATTDGGTASGPSPYRRPTLILDSVSIRLQGCIPFDPSATTPPAGAPGDGQAPVDASDEGGD
jgi:hypothetical protein